MGSHRRDLRQAVLEFISDHIALKGYPPTYQEIAEAVGLSGKSHVDYYLDLLEEAGLIARRPHTSRGLRLVGQASVFAVKVEGYIAAGQPIEVIRGTEDPIEITTGIADPARALFALKVQGDSMIEDLVANGDTVIVDRRGQPAPGQMAVVYLRDRNAATLKHVYLEGDQVRLQPAHPTMPAFYVKAEDVEIQGRVVAIIRRLG